MNYLGNREGPFTFATRLPHYVVKHRVIFKGLTNEKS